jgi:hypothetical protein
MPDTEAVLPLAEKLVDLAHEQQNALVIGAREQFNWIALRRDEVTDRLSALVAAGICLKGSDAEQLGRLRGQLLEVDQAMQSQLVGELRKAASVRRKFVRSRKAVGSYLQAGPRRGFLDTTR